MITILVTHRFSTVGVADLVVVLDRWPDREAGTHTELLAAGGQYAELFELQRAGVPTQLIRVPMGVPVVMEAAAEGRSMSKTWRGRWWSRARMKAVWSITPRPRSMTSW